MAPHGIEINDPVVRSKSTQKKLLCNEDREEYSNSKVAPQTDDIKEADSIYETQDTYEVDDEEDEVWSEEKQEKFEKWFSQNHELPVDIFSIPYGVGIGRGKRLVEVFQVRIISDVRRRQKLKVHGAITIYASFGNDDIFRRTPESPEMIMHKDSLTLTGPEIAATGYDVDSIEVYLMDGCHELCQGYVTMNYYQWNQSDYDRPLTEKIEGVNGFSAEVTYATFSRAALVSVEIKLPKIEVCGPIKVQGQIEASISGLGDFTSDVKTTLFKKKHKNYVSVSADGGTIPLSKSLVACPMHGALKLHLNLVLGKSRINKPVRFEPKCFGEKKVIVETEYGSISIIFTAYPPDFHPASLASYKDSFWRLMWPEECE